MTDLNTSISVRPREYAELKRVHRNTVYTWIRDGLLPCRKVRGLILINLAEADAALDKFKLN